MTIEEKLKSEYPGLEEHEIDSAILRCPWRPDCDRGRAYIAGYLDRAYDIKLYKVEKK